MGGDIEKQFFKNDYYCRLHHPETCFYCNHVVTQNVKRIKGDPKFYDSKTFSGKEIPFHSECLDIFIGLCN